MADSLTACKLSGLQAGCPEHFFEVLQKQAELRPEKEALIYGNCRISYKELLEKAGSIAEQLAKAGVKKQDRVGLLFPNHPDYVAAFFACAGLGLTIVPINPLLKADEIAHILSDSQSRVLIVHESVAREALKSQSQNQSQVLRHIFVSSDSKNQSDFPDLPTNANIQISALNLENRNAKVNWQQLDPQNDLALIVYTSGTTGKPKGAMLTHFNMLSIFPDRLDLFDINEKDRTLATLPMCHIYGITILMIGTLAKGGSLVILPRFEPTAVLKLIQNERITILPLVPAMYQFILLELEKSAAYDLSSVRICFSGAAALPPLLIKKIEEAFTAVLIEGYAMTETSCVATINPLKGKRKAASVGPALPGVEIRIVADDGRSLPAGPEHVGQLFIKGPNIMKGYYRQNEESARSIVDGWFATGDLGYMDEDGYVFIAGRKKEMIIRGGFNIYPREIEDLLAKLPEIAESAVIGIPCQYMGEKVKAVVVLKPGASLTEECIKEYCGEHLADYKVPRIFEFRDALPRNSTGKILKRILLEETKGT